MGTIILDRRLKATPDDLIPILKDALMQMGWWTSYKKRRGAILSFSIFGRSPGETTSLLPALGWITITGVQGESQVRLYNEELEKGAQMPDIQAYVDAQPYDVMEMFQDLAAFLIRAVEGEQPRQPAIIDPGAGQTKLLPTNPDELRVIADSEAGTILFRKDKQGGLVAQGGTINPGYDVVLIPKPFIAYGASWQEQFTTVDAGAGLKAEKPKQGGRKKLSEDDPKEFIYRLAKAQEGIEIYNDRKGSNFTWSNTCKQIGWSHGYDKSGVKLLYYARLDLAQLGKSDPDGWLEKVKVFREKEKKENE